MISDDDEAKISYKNPITKQNLQDALDFVFNDLETADYNNDTRPM